MKKETNMFTGMTSSEVAKILIKAQLSTDGVVKDNQANHVQAGAAMMSSKKETPVQYLINILRVYDDPASNKLTTDTYQNFVKGFRTRLQKTQGMTFKAVRRETIEKDSEGKKTGKGLGHHLVIDKVEVTKWVAKEIEPRQPKAPESPAEAKDSEQPKTQILTMEQVLGFIGNLSSQSDLTRVINKAKVTSSDLSRDNEIADLLTKVA